MDSTLTRLSAEPPRHADCEDADKELMRIATAHSHVVVRFWEAVLAFTPAQVRT